MNHARFSLVAAETSARVLTIRDLGPHDRHKTITNDAEYLVRVLSHRGVLEAGRRLCYYDTQGELAELVHDGRGRFLRFAPVATYRGLR